MTSAAKNIYQVSEAATRKLSQHGLLITRLLPEKPRCITEASKADGQKFRETSESYSGAQLTISRFVSPGLPGLSEHSACTSITHLAPASLTTSFAPSTPLNHIIFCSSSFLKRRTFHPSSPLRCSRERLSYPASSIVGQHIEPEYFALVAQLSKLHFLLTFAVSQGANPIFLLPELV